MAQQMPFEKLKEQIEAAKRGLIKMSDTEKADTTKNLSLAGLAQESLSSRSAKTIEAEPIERRLGEKSYSDPHSTEVVDMISKTVLHDAPTPDNAPGNDTAELAKEFQFFHRAKQPKVSSGLPSEVSLNEISKVEVEALSFERLGRRLSTVEGSIEENRKYILELINLLSQLDLRQELSKKKSQPLKRLNRRYMFWVVIGFLAMGWFGLTPSGHKAIQHFLAFI